MLTTLSFFCVFILGSCTPSSTALPPNPSDSQQPPTPTEVQGSDINTPFPETSPFEVRLAWYYNKPRTDEDMLQILNWYNFFILIKGDEKSRDQMLSLEREDRSFSTWILKRFMILDLVMNGHKRIRLLISPEISVGSARNIQIGFY